MGFGGTKKQESDQTGNLLRPRWIGKIYSSGGRGPPRLMATHPSPRTAATRSYKRSSSESGASGRKWVWTAIRSLEMSRNT